MKLTLFLVVAIAAVTVQGRPSPNAEPESSGIIRGHPEPSGIIRQNDPEQVEIIRSERKEQESGLEVDKEATRERRNHDEDGDDLLTQSIIRGHSIIRESPIIRKDSIIRNGKK